MISAPATGALLLASAALLGCGQLCPDRQPLLGTDGGTLTCVQSTDCPRPSNVLVCSSTADELRECVACRDGFCMRSSPRACP